MRRTVADILQQKGRQVWTIAPDAMVFDALNIMASKDIGALVVMENERVAGIMTERDYARKVILKDKRSKETLVREIMSSTFVFIAPEEDLEVCMALMTNKKVRHLPVMEQEKLNGIISIGDVVKGILDHKEFIINQLERFIKGDQG
jgi:predicted transcriptional regulator